MVLLLRVRAGGLLPIAAVLWWLRLARLLVVVVRMSACVARVSVGTRLFFFLQPPGKRLILTRIRVWVIAAKASLLAGVSAYRATCWRRISGGCASGRGFAGRIDGLSWLVPLRLLCVGVDVEPLVVLWVPDGLPAFGYLWRGRAL